MLRCARFAHTEFARGARAAPRTTPLLVARVARLGDARLVATAAGRRALFSALTQSQIDFFFFFSARVWDMCQVRDRMQLTCVSRRKWTEMMMVMRDIWR